MPIQILPPRLANQIAAGEVVERPASVVKELVENSIDAGATVIDIEIEKGGAQLIRIRDNGQGIEKQQLHLALSRHATSKISCIDDLESVMSMGFRGEALASVSSVSRLTLTSRTAEQSEAWQAFAEGNDMSVVIKPAAHPVGTTIEVADLFFNTPARRKFLRTEKTEFQHIDELLKRLALACEHIQFSLIHNGKLVRQYRKVRSGQNGRKRLAAICGNHFATNAIQISCEYAEYCLQGWLLADGVGRQNNDLSYSYVNGRMMRDKLINHAVRQGFEGYLPNDNFPAFVLKLTLPARQVDVNVHPAKHEVRFHQSRLVHDFIVQAIQSSLQQEQPLSRHPDEQCSTQHNNSSDSGAGADFVEAIHGNGHAHDPQLLDESRHDLHSQLRGVENAPQSYAHHQSNSPWPSSKMQTDRTRQQGASSDSTRSHQNYIQLMSPARQADELLADPSISAELAENPMLLINNGTHALVQTDRLYLLDGQACQHWLQWQQLQHQLSQGFVSQPLLLPVRLRMEADLIEMLLKLVPQFKILGIELIVKKPDTLILREVPAWLRDKDLVGLFDHVLARLDSQLDAASLLKKLVFGQTEGLANNAWQTVASAWEHNHAELIADCAVELSLQDALLQLQEKLN